jgi:uncharacterized protein YyaL (SSP411 family)
VAGLLLALRAAAAEPVPAELPGAPAFPPQLRTELGAELSRQGKAYEPRTRNLRADGSPLFTNRLLFEASPYLRQHAHNPVNWYPWGDAAFDEAKRLKRPVLVSIGYSTCHWCHVMEEESFDDPAIARLINERFVAIKVDREVRPDVDAIYMSAIHQLGRNGGWPLNVWVTPDREPFFAGTYFPPTDSRGRRGLPEVLRSIGEAWKQDSKRLRRTAAELTAAVRADLRTEPAASSPALDPGVLRAAYTTAVRGFDRDWGGAGRGRKFPANFPVRLLLRYHRRTGDAEALRMATFTLDKMASGGIHDQVGGGFHRYSVDRRWLVPHFEKMLYDNALRSVEFLEGWQATGREEFARVSRSTLDYVAREMTSPQGGFYSATDADSRLPNGEMEEGWYFTWTAAEIRAALSPEDAAAAEAFWGVTSDGNFEGRNVLHAWRSPSEVATKLGITEDVLQQRLARARRALADARDQRALPLRDDKVLVAWNGLMISAFARAGFAWGEPAYTEIGARAARFLLDSLRPKGRLVRAFTDGRLAGPAFLEDYAFLIAGLLDLYEADGNASWLREALHLQAELDDHYADDVGGGYFRTPDDGASLLVREKSGDDGAIPSGNSVAAANLLRLAELTADAAHAERAEMLFAAFADQLQSRPTRATELLLALDFLLDTPKEIVLVHPADEQAGLGELVAPLRRSFVPNRTLVVVAEGADLETRAELLPLVKGKTAQRGRATAYVCENRVCKAPTSDPRAFARQIGSVRPLD